jgi:Ca2+-binding RTX toxin-like protein
MSAIEKLDIANYNNANGADTFNMSAVSGVTDVKLSGTDTGGNDDTTLTNVANLVNLNLASNTNDVVVTYTTTVLTGSEDTQTVELNSNGSTTVNAPTLGIGDGSTGVAETLAINSASGTNYLAIVNTNNHKTVTVTGAGALTFGAGGEDTITKLDASASTGGVTINNLGASAIAITGGTGNDVVTDTNSNFDVNDTISAGDGTDTLGLIAAITKANAVNMSGFEVLSIVDDANAVSQDVSAFTGITTLSVNNASADTAADSLAFTSARGTESFIVTANDSADSLQIDLATDTTADSISGVLGNTRTAAGVTVATLDLDDYETVTLNSVGGANVVTNLTAGDLKTLTITGDKALTIDANSTGTWSNLTKIDASAATANINFAGTSGGLDAAATILGGSGNDTFLGSTAKDSISGGAGNDALVGAGGNDTIDGGDGNDTLTASGTNNDVLIGGAGADTITGATGNDSIDGGAGNDLVVLTTAVTTDLTSADTVNGGEGTDYFSIEGDANGGFSLDLSGTTLTNFAGVSNMEGISLNVSDSATASQETINLQVGDILLGSFNNNLTVTFGASYSTSHLAAAINASAVLNQASKVTFIGTTGNDANYTVGNGIDVVTHSDQADTVTVTNSLYLQATDTLAGGAGTDTLLFNIDADATISTSQVAGVSGFETWTITSDSATTDDFVFTLTDAIVDANKDTSTGTLTMAVTDDANNGTLKVTASSVTGAKLDITGGRGADTLIGGAGNDTLEGSQGADSLTGGAGNDVFQFAASSNGTDVITDFDFGTSTTTVDKLDFSATSLNLTFDAATDIAKQSAGTFVFAAGTPSLVIMDQSSYDTTTAGKTAMETALAALDSDTDATDAAGVYLVWQDSLGKVYVGYDADLDTDTGTGAGIVVLASLSNVTLAGVISNANFGDFIG